jgi:hypothetical protein
MDGAVSSRVILEKGFVTVVIETGSMHKEKSFPNQTFVGPRILNSHKNSVNLLPPFLDP